MFELAVQVSYLYYIIIITNNNLESIFSLHVSDQNKILDNGSNFVLLF